MEFRRQLTTAQVALVAVILVTALMTVVALKTTTSRGNNAYHQLANDLVLRDHVRRTAQLLTDATRQYLVESTDVRRSQLARLRRELDLGVDRLASRAGELRASSRDQLKGEIYGYAAWLSAVAAEHLAPNELERGLGARSADLETQLKLFGNVAKEHGAETFVSVKTFTSRALVGVVFTSAIGIAMVLVAGLIAVRNVTSHLRRVRAATAVAHEMAAARKDLIEVVSHDLRMPLNAISLSAALLLDAVKRENERNHIERIVGATERMEHLLDDLSDVARLESGRIELHYERFNTRTLMEVCIDMFFERAKAQGVRLRAECRDILSVRADRERIIQVFANLIGNALNFSGQDGTVTLSAVPEASGIRFAVTATGPGIAPDQRPQIFERNAQGRERKGKQGAGLGLYISKRLVEAHCGHIGVESELGEGSTFWFTIPD
jgi:signal transduction histidine kinase